MVSFQSDELATGLLTLGLRKGDRVGIWGPNSYEWILTQYATARAGLILVIIGFTAHIGTYSTVNCLSHHMNYSPAAIIRNAKIWNIILLLAFFRTLSLNLDLEYPAVSEENCLKNLLPLP